MRFEATPKSALTNSLLHFTRRHHLTSNKKQITMKRVPILSTSQPVISKDDRAFLSDFLFAQSSPQSFGGVDHFVKRFRRHLQLCDFVFTAHADEDFLFKMVRQSIEARRRRRRRGRGGGGRRRRTRRSTRRQCRLPVFLTLTTRFFPSDTLRATTGIFFPRKSSFFCEEKEKKNNNAKDGWPDVEWTTNK